MKRFVGYLIGKTARAKKVAPTITQPKQLKKTMKKIGEKYKYSSAREKEYIKRIDKVQKLKDKRKEGVKAGKDLKKMVDTKQAEKIGKRIYSKKVPDKRTKGTGKKGEFVVDTIERKGKVFGGIIGKKKKKPETEKQKSIKEKILPKKKKDRLNQLRKELGMKKGGSALKPVDKEKNPGLAKLPTQVRNKMGYMKKGGQVRKFGGGKK
tara:strand:- start:98 stop:721 length:624 start_codon:yes stop_codon:yes gene_type:complete